MLKILMLSNFDDDCKLEDIWISRAFQEDGHQIYFVSMDHDERMEEMCDVVIRRNTWFEDENKVSKYNEDTNRIKEIVFNRDIVRINFDGKFDANGKDYLVDLYQKGYSVIPSISNIEEFSKLPEVDNYLLKPKNSYDGYGQRRGSKEYILSQFTPNDIIQPMISFQSEVEFYFVGNELQYAFEYVPNKLVERYEVKEYHYSSEEHFLAQTFADLNPDFNGVQRIDFLKQKDGTLLLLEIEDCAPYLNLEMLSEEKREQFIANYKDMVYQCVKKYTKRR